MSITKLHITGFQSLADVELDLGGLTAVVGASNSGKSAIRRALWALATNAPPAGFLRNGAAAMTVELETDEGTGVQWTKAVKGTTYKVVTNRGQLNETVLLIEKPGSATPPEVAEVLRLADVNFASQFDLPFLLADPPSAAAKALGDLTNLTVLLEGVREAERRRRAADKDATTYGAIVERATDVMETYSDLPAQDARLRAISELLTAATHAVTFADQMGARATLAEQLERDLLTAEDQLAGLPDIPANLFDVLELHVARAQSTTTLLQQARGAHQRATEAEQALQRYTEPPELPYDAVERAHYLSQYRDSALGWSHAIDQQAQIAADAGVELAQIDSDIAAIPTCPTCGQAIA